MRTRVLYTVCQQIPTKRAPPSWNSNRSIRALFSSTVQATTISTDNDYSSSSVVKIHSALDLGCIDYTKSWAWQHILLSRRLALRRRRNQQQQQGAITQPQDDEDEDSDSDCLLLLEHHPVYTLGRGADESHLTFLQPNCETSQAMRQPLSRKVRGPGTARLAVDRQSEELASTTPMNQAIHQLCQSVGAIPVLAPNEVPIFRVERGGEVTFHGPSQLVVYPLLDLTRPPYQKDLHWYLRMVEEVVIQTLQHYDIDSVRDDESTGTKYYIWLFIILDCQELCHKSLLLPGCLLTSISLSHFFNSLYYFRRLGR
jgi:lipoate-protein ligase B